MNTVYQISDCHLSDESSYENLRKALEHVANDPTCENIFLTGDICCNPKSGDYIRLEAFIRQHIGDQSIYAIAGNHDDSRLMRTELKGSTIVVTDKATVCERQFLFLDSSYKPLDSRHPLGSGRIDNRGMTRLKQQLRKTSSPIVIIHHPLGSGRIDNRGMTRLKQQLRKTSSPIVVIHHPVIPVGAEWMKVICLENDVDVMSLLRKHSVREVICGHGHDGITVTQQGVTQYMAPSTAYGFDHSINEYNRSEKIGISRIRLSANSIDYQAVYF